MSGPGSDKIWNNALICIHKQSHNLQLQNSLALPESNVDISNYDNSLLYWWLVEMVLLVAFSVTIMSDSLQTSQLCRHQQVWVLGPCINSDPTLWACNISLKKDAWRYFVQRNQYQRYFKMLWYSCDKFWLILAPRIFDLLPLVYWKMALLSFSTRRKQNKGKIVIFAWCRKSFFTFWFVQIFDVEKTAASTIDTGVLNPKHFSNQAVDWGPRNEIYAVLEATVFSRIQVIKD